MSKIKDLYAIENGIDDLIPPRKVDLKQVAERVAVQVDYNWALNEFKDNAEFTSDYDDDGHKVTYFENFIDICNNIAECVLDLHIQREHLDLTDEEYREVRARAADIIANNFADEEDEIIKEAKADQKEMWEQFTSYNEATLPKD